MEASKKGCVFAIKRFAIHDGEGIRTTIFLKGCNLRCQWCHNPEGLAMGASISVVSQKCIYCRRCLTVDQEQVMIDTGKGMKIESKEGIEYQKYIDICPTGAIQYDAHYYSVEELLTAVMKDQVFFQQGGGITLSGGEPLLQTDFITMFLKRCQQLEIQTAIETALHVPSEVWQRVVPYVDILYCDIKEIEGEKHRKFTQVDNQQILDNITYLLTSEHKKKVIVRTPLIPQYTATVENIKQIANYIYQRYPEVTYEILNYNPLAISKYQELQKEYPISYDILPFSDKEMNSFRQIAREEGIKKVI